MIGESVKRFEDARLLTGGGRYTGDHNAPGQAHAVFLRSPHAHAELLEIDCGAARAMAGVLGIFTALDLAAGGIKALPGGVGVRAAEQPNRDGTLMADPPLPVLAGDRVRHVGEPVAVVIAETPDLARDAAEAISVGYRPLQSVTATGAALAPGAPELWHEARGNLVFDYGAGDEVRAATRLCLPFIPRLELIRLAELGLLGMSDGTIGSSKRLPFLKAQGGRHLPWGCRCGRGDTRRCPSPR